MRATTAFLLTFSFLLFAKEEKDIKKHIKPCPPKITCSKIKTCKEAYYYLQKCKIKKLDRDKDGIPCEKLCKQPHKTLSNPVSPLRIHKL